MPLILQIIYLLLFIGSSLYFITNKKIPIGLTILYISLGILLYLYVPLNTYADVLKLTFKNETMYRLIVIIFLILFFSKLLKVVGLLDRAVNTLGKIFKNKSHILPIFPALIGLLPMPGGAMFSAPMVNSISEDMDIKNEEKTYINFWFRHMWEPILPLYPGFILQIELVRIASGNPNTIVNVLLWQFPITLLVFITGYIFKLRSISKKTPHNHAKVQFSNVLELIKNIWPILLLILLVIFIRIEFAFLITFIIILTLIINYKKVTLKVFWKILKGSISPLIILLIFSVFFFQSTMHKTGLLNNLSYTLNSLGIPVEVVIFTVPLIVGILSGLTVTYIAITFPIILPLISGGSFEYNLVALGFLGGYLGVLLSPVHLCLVLTNEYFGSSLKKVYGIMFRSALGVSLYAIFLGLI